MAHWVDVGATLSQLAEADTDKLLASRESNIGLGVTPKDQVRKFYEQSSDNKTLESKAWLSDPHFFHTVHISSLALMKMSLHARSGGSIEIMGMMTGKIFDGNIVVLDSYPLPVQGTESRVNPLNEAYEFMLQFLEQQKKQCNRSENIVGWYHSHPGFGCWLSGIDVKTQELNQGFQDPYVAVVIDPEKSRKQGLVDIGAFRTYYPEHRAVLETQQPRSAKRDLGHHGDKYYSLDVSIFKSDKDEQVFESLNSKFWYKDLVQAPEQDQVLEINKISNVSKEISRLKPVLKKNAGPPNSASSTGAPETMLHRCESEKVSKTEEQARNIGLMLNSLAMTEYDRILKTEVARVRR
ncbi:hypothetical protein KL911_004641 [Ogataea haglerorum]|uniref:uncharacterized protein n=1 Tax=Ogataea haglerorum TaxID=1937702 RepID=UPI001C899899|nr:uncharacterized protein KL911_004641 [Ogataea haglerorum]KAG7750762.1 hypothetical protein KL911_004641 [Ogataea haglerorum]